MAERSENYKPSDAEDLPQPSGMHRTTSIRSFAENIGPPGIHVRPSASVAATQKTERLSLLGFEWDSIRGWNGILKLLGYYFGYYAFLTILIYSLVINETWGFWASNFCPLNAPRTQARLHTPGLAAYPAMLSGNGHKATAELGHVMKLSSAESNSFYEGKMRNFENAYNETQYSMYDNYDWIKAQCGSNYGYEANGSPCVVFYLNNIINWKLIGLTGDVQPKQGPKISGDGNHAHIHCDIYDAGENNKIDYTQTSNKYTIEWVEPGLNYTYSSGTVSEPGKIHKEFYPFNGLSKGKNTLSGEYKNYPIRANKPFKIAKLKRTNVEAGTANVNFKCSAYADNIHNSFYDSETGRYEWQMPGNNPVSDISYANPVLAEFSVTEL